MPSKKRYNHVNIDHVFTPLKCVTGETGRYYVTEDGERYFSVTTVTGFEKSQFFAEWRRKNPEESKRVTRRGNNLHSIIEDYLNNKVVNPSDDVMDLFVRMLPMLHKIDNIHAQEVPLWSKLLKLAGRVDCVAEYDGKLSIIDFKGSTRHKRESDIQNYFQQATAYAVMWQERTGQSIEQIVILISNEDGTTQELVRKPLDYVADLHQTVLKFRKSKMGSSTKENF